MPDDTPNLNLPLIQPGQAQKHVTHNEALERLDALVQLSVTDLFATAPPAAPADGQVVGIGAGATGAFEDRDGQLACYSNGAWLFLDAKEGQRAWNAATQVLSVRIGTGWEPFAPLCRT